jgi:hypothetical protein
MPKKYLISLMILVLAFAVGCATENSPPVEEQGEDETSAEAVTEPTQEATSTVQPLDSYPAGEPAEAEQPIPEAYPAGERAEAEQAAPEPYPAAEEQEEIEGALQLQPASPMKGPQNIKNINLAKADLAGRMGLNLPSTEIEVVAFEEVIWSDSSLGCPEPDAMYTQTVIDGYVIQLQIGEQIYNYHGATGEEPFLCLSDSGLETAPGDEAQVEAKGSNLDPDAERAVNLAKNELVSLFGADFSLIELASYESVTWNDTSLGCPQPDMGYAQILVDGYKIQLQIHEMTFNFHGAIGEVPFLCLNTSEPQSNLDAPAEEAMVDSETQIQIEQATIDLADRLGVKPGAVTLISYEPVTWGDGSLGCPQPDMMYTQALVDGYQIQLQVDGQVYNYHGANGEDPFLCEN